MNRLGSLILVTGLAACASSPALIKVEARDWRVVPAASREATASRAEEAMQSAREEKRVALAERERAQKAIADDEQDHRAAKPRARASDDLQRAHDRKVEQARLDVEAKQEAWLTADLVWRERRVEQAEAHLSVVEAEQELARAQLVYEYIADDSGFDPSPYRGQLARRQEPWVKAKRSADEARRDQEGKQQALLASKAEYARLCQEIPPPPKVAKK